MFFVVFKAVLSYVVSFLMDYVVETEILDFRNLGSVHSSRKVLFLYLQKINVQGQRNVKNLGGNNVVGNYKLTPTNLNRVHYTLLPKTGKIPNPPISICT